MLNITQRDDWQPNSVNNWMLIGQLGHLHMLEVTLEMIDS